MLPRPTVKHKWPLLEYGTDPVTLAFRYKVTPLSDGRTVIGGSVDCMYSGRTLFHLALVCRNFYAFRF